jgi:GTP-binding protein
VGLIGLPNAGKSSILNALTRAKAVVANYPFTTLEPNLGVAYGKVLADIPGLIEGAAQGRGLGIAFLRHVRRTKLLAHCISVESDDPARDYLVVRKELEAFDKRLMEKPELVVLTKVDLVDAQEAKRKLTLLKKLTKDPITSSTENPELLKLLLKRLIDFHA